MNICPECEEEMEEGLELCPACAGQGEEKKEKHPREGAMLVLENGQQFSLRGETAVLGRSDPLEGIDPEVELSLCGGYERGVSRRHALIRRDGEKWSLEDLGSTNGTILNQEKVVPGQPVPLAEGDVIHLGRLKAVFTIAGDAGGAS
jgi:pSer/pThr/pTyr-binding forkhead associated (FHA) protein